MPQVSVIVPTYRSRERLRNCLLSIYGQPPKRPFEVLVVEDASRDGSAEMVRQEFPLARLLVNDENLGYGASCNKALGATRSRWVHLLNNDVELMPGAIDALADFLESHPEAGAAGSLLYNSDGTIQASAKAHPSCRSAFFGARSYLARWFPNNRFTRAELLHWRAADGPFTAGYVSSASLMLPREDLTGVGALDDRLSYFIDADLCRRLWDRGRAVYYIPESRAVHHAHQGGTQVSLERRLRSLLEFHRGAYRYYRRHGGKPAWHPANAIVAVALALRFVPSLGLWGFQELARPFRRGIPTKDTAPERIPVVPDEKRLDVSVVIANYKAREVLAGCLSSIYRTPPKGTFEVIVVDDASGDGSVEMVRERFPSVTLFANERNAGYASSCNRALAVARGSFLYLLNNDVELHPGVIDELVGFLRSHPEAGCAGSLLYNTDGSIQASVKALPSVRSALFGARSVISRWFPDNRFTKQELFHRGGGLEPFTAGYVSGSSLMVRREVFERIGLLDTSLFYFNDADFCKRIWDAGLLVYYVPGARATHHAHSGGSMVSLKQRFWSLANFHVGAFRYYRKHGGKASWHPMNLVVAASLGLRFAVAVPLHLGRELAFWRRSEKARIDPRERSEPNRVEGGAPTR